MEKQRKIFIGESASFFYDDKSSLFLYLSHINDIIERSNDLIVTMSWSTIKTFKNYSSQKGKYII